VGRLSRLWATTLARPDQGPTHGSGSCPDYSSRKPVPAQLSAHLTAARGHWLDQYTCRSAARSGRDARTSGLRVDCCGAPPALPALTSQGSARNTRNAQGCDWCSFHEPFHDVHDKFGEHCHHAARAESDEEARGSWWWARCRRTPTRRSPGKHRRGHGGELPLAWVMFGKSCDGVVLPPSLFEHPSAELSVDDSAQLSEEDHGQPDHIARLPTWRRARAYPPLTGVRIWVSSL